MAQLHISGNIRSCGNISTVLGNCAGLTRTFAWLLQTRGYRNWLGGISEGGSNGSALFCYGGPGVGKTYISSLAIDTLSEQAVEGDAVVAYFYVDCAIWEEQSLAAILGSVLKQIVGGLDEVLERIVEAFRNRIKVMSDGRKLVLSEIVELLQDISASRCAYICANAQDKCQAIHRAKLLDSLNQILQGSPGARIF